MFSPQTMRLYQKLVGSIKPLMAIELADQLKIAPNAVYYLVKPLEDMGLVEISGKYPKRFLAKSLDESLGLYLMKQSEYFSSIFGKKNKQFESSSSMEQVFIHGRDQLMKRATEEINFSKTSIDLLRSGHELMPETMLACLKAVQRGVRLRMLIQDYDSSNKKQVLAWQKNGFQIRKTEMKNMRLMLFDLRAIYFMSYKHSDSKKDAGMKITYTPFATMLSQVFNELWSEAEEVL